MFWVSFVWCIGGLSTIRTVVGLVGLFAEVALGAYQLVSSFSMASALCAAVLGLTPFAGAAADAVAIKPTAVTVAARLPVGFMISLDHDVLPAYFALWPVLEERGQRRGASTYGHYRVPRAPPYSWPFVLVNDHQHQYIEFNVVLEGEADEDHDGNILWVNGSLYSLQLLHHLIHP